MLHQGAIELWRPGRRTLSASCPSLLEEARPCRRLHIDDHSPLGKVALAMLFASGWLLQKPTLRPVSLMQGAL